jgi:hypothetical protein
MRADYFSPFFIAHFPRANAYKRLHTSVNG